MNTPENLFRNISWPLFYQQKLAICEMQSLLTRSVDPRVKNATKWLDGILNMMDVMGDIAEQMQLFTYPGTDEKGCFFDNRFNNVLMQDPTHVPEKTDTNPNSATGSDNGDVTNHVVTLCRINDEDILHPQKMEDDFIMEIPNSVKESDRQEYAEAILRIMAHELLTGKDAVLLYRQSSNDFNWGDWISNLTIKVQDKYNCHECTPRDLALSSNLGPVSAVRLVIDVNQNEVLLREEEPCIVQVDGQPILETYANMISGEVYCRSHLTIPKGKKITITFVEGGKGTFPLSVGENEVLKHDTEDLDLFFWIDAEVNNMNYVKDVKMSFKTLKHNYELATMTGTQLYAKYGIKHGETLWEISEEFPDGYHMEVKSIAGEEDESAQISVLLLDQNGDIVMDNSENYDDDMVMEIFSAEGDDGTNYSINVLLEPCAIALRCEDGEKPYTAYIDSEWFVRYAADGNLGDLPFRFLAEYTSKDAVRVISDAILAGKLGMVEYDDGTTEITEKYHWVLDAAKKQLANKANYIKAMQCLVDNGIARDEAYNVLEAMLAILNDSDASDVLDQKSVEQFEYDSAVEELKRAVFMDGHDAIEDFLGTEFSDSMSHDAIDILMDEIIKQMPSEDLDNYFKKYGVENTGK